MHCNDSLDLNLKTIDGRIFAIAIVQGYPAFHSGQVIKPAKPENDLQLNYCFLSMIYPTFQSVQIGDEILDIQGISVTGRSNEISSGFKQELLGPKVHFTAFRCEI